MSVRTIYTYNSIQLFIPFDLYYIMRHVIILNRQPPVYYTIIQDYFYFFIKIKAVSQEILLFSCKYFQKVFCIFNSIFFIILLMFITLVFWIKLYQASIFKQQPEI